MPRQARHGDVAGCGASLISGASKTYVNEKRRVVRLGDGSDHGGTVISASGVSFAEGKGIARLGDMHSCPIPGHGITPISSASDDTYSG